LSNTSPKVLDCDRLLLLGLSPDTDEIRIPRVIFIPETRIECMTPSIAINRDKG
jgi:hypothetical protein